jgi:hypothetical protein
MLVLGTAGTILMARMRVTMLVRGMIVGMRGDGGLQVVRKPWRGAAECERNPRRNNAKQVQQSDKPPRSDPALSRESNEHTNGK